MPKLAEYFTKTVVQTGVAAYSEHVYPVPFPTDLNDDGLADIVTFGATYPFGDQVNTPKSSLLFLSDPELLYGLDATGIELPKTVHPRWPLAADFNNDGKDDLFLADHGWDTFPLPGHQNQLLLSNAEGFSTSSDNLPQKNDFTHTAAVGDIDNDGNMDIFVGNVDTTGSQHQASILFGDGKGNFTESTEAVPSDIRGPIRFPASNLVDLNSDGWVDLLIGNSGNEANIKKGSLIYWNNEGTFSNDNSTELPNGYFGKNNEHVMDMHAANIDSDDDLEIIILSTQLNPYYDGWSLQILDKVNGEYVDITSDSFGETGYYYGEPGVPYTSTWNAFVKLADINNDSTLDLVFSGIHKAVSNTPLYYLNDGFGHFEATTVGDVVESDEISPYFWTATSFSDEEGLGWISSFVYQSSVWIRQIKQNQPIDKAYKIKATINDDLIQANSSDNEILGLGGNDVINAGGGNDVIDAGEGDNIIDGGDGVDLVIQTETRSNAQLSVNEGSITITSTLRTTTDTLKNVERVEFSDAKLAFDFDGNAGITAKILGAFLGASGIQRTDLVGVGLDLLDSGTTYEEFLQAALDAVFGSNPSGANLVNHFYGTLTGQSAPQSLIDQYGSLIDNGSLSPVSLAMQVAENELNLQNIDLVGLATTGIEYT